MQQPLIRIRAHFTASSMNSEGTHSARRPLIRLLPRSRDRKGRLRLIINWPLEIFRWDTLTSSNLMCLVPSANGFLERVNLCSCRIIGRFLILICPRLPRWRLILFVLLDLNSWLIPRRDTHKRGCSDDLNSQISIFTSGITITLQKYKKSEFYLTL